MPVHPILVWLAEQVAADPRTLVRAAGRQPPRPPALAKEIGNAS